MAAREIAQHRGSNFVGLLCLYNRAAERRINLLTLYWKEQTGVTQADWFLS